jgi:predicted nucleic acid-binding protein
MVILAEPRKIYWDACVWIALISGESGRVERCESIVHLAQAGDFQIWTSSLTLAEVFKHRVGPHGAALAADKDDAFEAFLLQDFVFEAQVDHAVGVYAKKLLRQYAPLKKPADAVHLATALMNNLNEFHTFDGANLIPLSEKVFRADGAPLLIREPPPPIIGKQLDFLATPPPNDETPKA